MNNERINHTAMNAYTYLANVQSAYAQYLQVKIQLRLQDNNLKIARDVFEKTPNVQNLGTIQTAWSQEFGLLQQIPTIAETIVANLVSATKETLQNMRMNLASSNTIGTLLCDNVLASINSYIKENSNNINVKSDYKQQCIISGIHILISDLEMRIKMSGIQAPNFDYLKLVIRGY